MMCNELNIVHVIFTNSEFVDPQFQVLPQRLLQDLRAEQALKKALSGIVPPHSMVSS